MWRSKKSRWLTLEFSIEVLSAGNACVTARIVYEVRPSEIMSPTEEFLAIDVTIGHIERMYSRLRSLLCKVLDEPCSKSYSSSIVACRGREDSSYMRRVPTSPLLLTVVVRLVGVTSGDDRFHMKHNLKIGVPHSKSAPCDRSRCKI